MLNFFRNQKGFVTVFVTLMLIPALLISGTAVDIARVYAAKSMVEDANLLAANAALTQYDATLQDIYGLYGIMESDEELASMITEYVTIAILGEDYQQEGMGTLQLFANTDDPTVAFSTLDGHTLANAEVIRRQIEEYVKYEAPIIIVDEVLGLLDAFEKTAADSDAIQTKVEIEEDLADLNSYYEDVYDQINAVDKFDTKNAAQWKIINDRLVEIQDAFEKMYDVRGYYVAEMEKENPNDDYLNDYNIEYEKRESNIRSLIHGGEYYSLWMDGYYNDEGDWIEGFYASWKQIDGLTDLFDDYQDFLTDYSSEFSKLQSLCSTLDSKCTEISVKLNSLKTKLASGDCSDELVAAMNEKDENGVTVLESYETLLNYNTNTLATQYKTANSDLLTEYSDMVDNISKFGQVVNNTVIGNYVEVPNVSFDDYCFEINYSEAYSTTDILRTLAQLDDSSVKYTISADFTKYENVSDSHNEFYDALNNMYKSGGTADAADEAEGDIWDLMGAVQTEFKNMVSMVEADNEGADYYKVSGSNESGGGTMFEDGADWGDDEGSFLSDALDNPIFAIGGLVDDIVNKLLLVVYDAKMFSDFSTNKGEDKEMETLTGVPLGTEVNYFYQAELEYLYHGNEESAQSNVRTVLAMMLLIRFVNNYISSFSVSSVETEITTIAAGTGPFAPLVKELGRLAYALGESIIDLNTLTAGKGVPLLKDKDSWKFSLDGIANSALDSSASSAISGKDSSTDSATDLYYSDYMTLLLLLVGGDDLGKRTARLIELNMTNYEQGVNADEDTMSAVSAADFYDMSSATTSFSITTQLNLKMMFLSLPVAQQGVLDTVPPTTFGIEAITYRGY